MTENSINPVFESNADILSHRGKNPKNTGHMGQHKMLDDSGATDLKTEKMDQPKSRLTFQINDRPPFHISLFYGFQIIFCNLPGAVAAVFVSHQITCGGRDYEYLAKLMSSVIFMCGFASLIQVLFGSRLPITQGSSFVFFSPIAAMMSAEKWKCSEPSILDVNELLVLFVFEATLAIGLGNSTQGLEAIEPEWASRVRQVSGGLVGASLVQVFLGATGTIGFLMRYIGPITLAPTVMLIGLTLFPFAVDSAKHHWWIAMLTIALIVLFSVVCAEVQVPIVTWNRERGFHIRRYPLIRMFANILSMGLAWILCYILTATGKLPEDSNELGYLARTDAKVDAIEKMPWFYFPYPGQFGMITFGADIFVGMLAVTISSTVESIGDYYATARIAEVPKPPIHALNRGIALEGIASIFSGLAGCSHGTTSYSNVIGFIAYTGVASRFTWVIMSILLMVFAVFGKLAGALATIPEPIVGGTIALCLGLVVLIGISQLHSVDLMSIRNQITLAVAIGLGMQFPDFLARTPGAINTGNEVVDRTIYVFFSTGPFVGGLLAFILDNLLPGTREERGMLPEEEGVSTSGHRLTPEETRRLYDFPFPTLWLAKYKICTYLPFMPCSKERNCRSVDAEAAESSSKGHTEDEIVSHMTSM